MVVPDKHYLSVYPHCLLGLGQTLRSTTHPMRRLKRKKIMHAVLNEHEVTMMDGYPDTDSAGSVSWRTEQKASWALSTEFYISHCKGEVVDPWSRSIRLGLQNTAHSMPQMGQKAR